MLIKLLFSTQIVSAFGLHRDMKLSVSQIVRLIDKFTADDIVKIEKKSDNDLLMELTQFGRKWLLENEYWLIQGSSKKYWRRTPVEFQDLPSLEE